MFLFLLLLCDASMALPMRFPSSNPSSSLSSSHRLSRHFHTPKETSSVPENTTTSIDPLFYLYRFGYINPVSVRSNFNSTNSAPMVTAADPKAVRAAVIEFQDFAGLPTTGELDKETLALMQQPRCGVADKGATELRIRRYVVHGSR